MLLHLPIAPRSSSGSMLAIAKPHPVNDEVGLGGAVPIPESCRDQSRITGTSIEAVPP